MVDAGPDKKILDCLGRHMPFWDRNIELAIITNPDLDHYGGFIDIVRQYEVGQFAVAGVGKNDAPFEALEKEVEIREIRVIRVIGGNKIRVGNLEFNILWPKKEDIELLSQEDEKNSKVLGESITEYSPNEFSIVTEFSFGEFQALLTGDIEPPATDGVAEEIRETLEVLKVPHHGSKNGLTQSMLEAARPRLAIISAGKKNRFGHPHQETLELLGRLGVKTLGTYKEGEIEITTDGKTYRLSD